MKEKCRKFNGGGHLALALGAILLSVGLANATWVYHFHSFGQNHFGKTTQFNPDRGGNHWHKAHAPVQGTITSVLTSPSGTVLSTIVRIDNDCFRELVNLSGTSAAPHKLTSTITNWTSGDGGAWVAHELHPDLFPCNIP